MTRRRYIDRIKQPQGRIDWLAAKLLEKAVEKRANPLLQALYAEFQPDIERAIRAQFGPKNRSMRKLKQYVVTGTRLLEAQSKTK